jgi:hypothetical protein
MFKGVWEIMRIPHNVSEIKRFTTISQPKSHVLTKIYLISEIYSNCKCLFTSLALTLWFLIH